MKPNNTNRKGRYLALGLLVAVGCGGGLGGILISNQQEVEIGVSVAEQIAYEYKLADPTDPLSVWAVQLVNPLVPASKPFRDPDEFGGYKVAVIFDNELVNAFAAPGGYTYLSTGLILQASSCAEIVGVMGHELGHVTERHGALRVEEAMAAGLLTELLFGEGVAAETAAALYQVILGGQFSQEDEAESDNVGLQIAFEAGYNPYGLVDFFETLLDLAGDGEIPDFLQFLSSHPATQDRIDDVSAEIQRRYGAQVVRGETQSYACLGTTQTLAQIQAHITSGQVKVLAGTGEGPPADAGAQGATDDGSGAAAE